MSEGSDDRPTDTKGELKQGADVEAESTKEGTTNERTGRRGGGVAEE